MTLTNGITAGSYYRFRVRAKNIFGWGEYSAEANVQAATAPSKMDTVTTSIDATTGGVKIEFTSPHDNSSPIDYYFIEIANQAGTSWFEDTTNCYGQS